MKEDQDLSTFCVRPWTHFFTDNWGRVMPCCLAQSVAMDPVNTPANIPQYEKKSSIENLWNSESMKKIRLDMLNGRKPSECRYCYLQESKGISSSRLEKNAAWTKTSLQDLAIATKEDGSVQPYFHSVDLRLGNSCNLRCRMCNPRSSILLTKEWSASGDPWMKEVAQPFLEKSPSCDDLIERALQIVDSAGEKLEHIRFAGGEPALIPEHLKILDHLIETGRSQNIVLSYNTNLTKSLPGLEYYLDKFKGIHVFGSIDAVGELNHYIRYPSKWRDIEENMFSLNELRKKFPTLFLYINTTVQALNIAHLDELLIYMADTPLQYWNRKIYFSLLTTPSHFSIQALPQEIKQLARNKFEQFCLGSYAQGDKAWVDLLQKWRAMLDHMDAHHSPELTEKFFHFTRYFDGTRNQRFTTSESAQQTLY